ncbi:MAG: hypothetical protein SV910_06575 [Chloroflexota bacterium]|nr:hypothetical protein [Chloroflexota bacterium]
MDETHLSIEVAKGLRDVINELVGLNIPSTVSELKDHNRLLDEHAEKLDRLTECVRLLEIKQNEIMERLGSDQCERHVEVAPLQAATRKEAPHSRQSELRELFAGNLPKRIIRRRPSVEV